MALHWGEGRGIVRRYLLPLPRTTRREGPWGNFAEKGFSIPGPVLNLSARKGEDGPPHLRALGEGNLALGKPNIVPAVSFTKTLEKRSPQGKGKRKVFYSGDQHRSSTQRS